MPSAGHLSRVLGIPIRTARRWVAAGRMPRPWDLMWALLAEKDIGALDAAWRGWKFHQGQLCSPDGVPWRPGEIVATYFQLQELAGLRAQVRTFQGLDAQPLPGVALPALAKPAARGARRQLTAQTRHR